MGVFYRAYIPQQGIGVIRRLNEIEVRYFIKAKNLWKKLDFLFLNLVYKKNSISFIDNCY